MCSLQDEVLAQQAQDSCLTNELTDLKSAVALLTRFDGFLFLSNFILPVFKGFDLMHFWLKKIFSGNLYFCTFFSNRHLICDFFLENKTEGYQNYSVLYCLSHSFIAHLKEHFFK